MKYEIRKPIPNYYGYEVSSWGKVYRYGREIRQEANGKGYLRVDLYNENGRKHFKVHRLVAEAFIPNPKGKPQVNHKDGNKRNNSITNLEWVTDRENKDHAVWMRKMMNEERGYYTYIGTD